MADNTVTIEIDGVPVEARAGQMLIEVTDREDAYVPRFCYHRKLSVAANCRMCLVEVERAPKPLPACATPVMDGMKVFTRSPAAISAQKATMEFLLINHPLDCPICDQGGECELQDLAMGYGRGVSRYTEKKRVVKDKNLGPLVSTDMTRCIHCTRCVRFGEEIAGIQELGATGRSEDMEIGTWVERSVDHELSGNIIDLCPVGALNNKPYRYSARAWEMVARPLVSPHDCAGSNLYGHVLRGKLKRVVPRDNDAINETWISDRDRFSYEGIYTGDRLMLPRVYGPQGWADIGWSLAVDNAAETLRDAAKQGGDGLGFLVSPNATVEEMYLLNRIARHLGSNNIDHRLRSRDFRDQGGDPLWPALGTSIAGLDDLEGVLVVGSNLRMEVPILAHRIRNSALNGAAVGFVNPAEYEYHFRYDVCVPAPLSTLAGSLADVLAAACELSSRTPGGEWQTLLDAAEPGEPERTAARLLLDKSRALLLLGQIAMRHPRFADIRSIAAALCRVTGATLGYLPEGANAAGAALAGVLPHRGPGGQPLENPGLSAEAMLAAPRRVYVLFGLEPEHDLSDALLAQDALGAADKVICFTSHSSDALEGAADILLPIATFAETAGTYVNVEGSWQSVEAAADTVGEAREGWRVLRVLGNHLGLPDCEYRSAVDIREELTGALGNYRPGTAYEGGFIPACAPAECDEAVLDVPIYSVDPIVRRGQALQQTAAARETDPAAADAR
ncbi:MAG: NADH-quinone oxidoreductase subunit G [Proteobacteria bacterium]|nr:NADH-quinone oxidoreductase subunit G [Pseudomonadota bacterium]MYJ96024.1 NADH-quinone oxidoreductase subunit G [Pseudomonadota bacterium]